MSESDRVILILGKTGAGKSTFINFFPVDHTAVVEDSADSVTCKVEEHHFQHKVRPGELLNVTLIDTVGFDHSPPPGQPHLGDDHAILEMIKRFLEGRYQALSGVIFIHPITERIGDATADKIGDWTSLLGQEAGKKVVLVTTKWTSEGDRKEKQLKEHRLFRALAGGGDVRSLHIPSIPEEGDQVADKQAEAKRAAWAALTPFLDSPLRNPIQVVDEFNNTGNLPSTTFGKDKDAKLAKKAEERKSQGQSTKDIDETRSRIQNIRKENFNYAMTMGGKILSGSDSGVRDSALGLVGEATGAVLGAYGRLATGYGDLLGKGKGTVSQHEAEMWKDFAETTQTGAEIGENLPFVPKRMGRIAGATAGAGVAATVNHLKSTALVIESWFNRP